jgi:hypothetical protein
VSEKRKSGKAGNEGGRRERRVSEKRKSGKAGNESGRRERRVSEKRKSGKAGNEGGRRNGAGRRTKVRRGEKRARHDGPRRGTVKSNYCAVPAHCCPRQAGASDEPGRWGWSPMSPSGLARRLTSEERSPMGTSGSAFRAGLDLRTIRGSKRRPFRRNGPAHKSSEFSGLWWGRGSVVAWASRPCRPNHGRDARATFRSVADTRHSFCRTRAVGGRPASSLALCEAPASGLPTVTTVRFRNH